MMEKINTMSKINLLKLILRFHLPETITLSMVSGKWNRKISFNKSILPSY